MQYEWSVLNADTIPEILPYLLSVELGHYTDRPSRASWATGW